MHRNPREVKLRRPKLQTWNYAEARQMLPYLASVMRSLRDSWLEQAGHDRTAARLGGLPGRPDRSRLIAEAEAKANGVRAGARFQETLKELARLDVRCLDPIRGEALIPFRYAGRRAWFLYSHFESDPLRSWRYHDDPPATRRPMAEMLTGER